MKNFAYICSAEQTHIESHRHIATSNIGVVSYLSTRCWACSAKQKGAASFLLPQVAKITGMQNKVITSNPVKNSSFVASIQTITSAIGVLMLLTLPALGDSSPRIIFGWLAISAALIFAGKGFFFQRNIR